LNVVMIRFIVVYSEYDGGYVRVLTRKRSLGYNDDMVVIMSYSRQEEEVT